MEKFAVDLDKVLDDFEFHEEQAVRRNCFRREDLPATKYQKPHFQPINLADADFSPSVQTTTLYQPVRKPSDESVSSLESTTLVIPDRTQVVEPVVAVVEPQSQQIQLHHDSKKQDEEEISEDEQEVELAVEDVESNASEDLEESATETRNPPPKGSLLLDLLAAKVVEAETSRSKPDLLGNGETDNSDCNVRRPESLVAVSNLPDLTEVGQELVSETQFDSLDLIRNEKEAVLVQTLPVQEEVAAVIIERPILQDLAGDLAGHGDIEKGTTPVQTVSAVIIERSIMQDTGDLADSADDREVEDPFSEEVVDATLSEGECLSENVSDAETLPETRPLQFEAHLNVSDDDLEKYLEELEEEDSSDLAEVKEMTKSENTAAEEVKEMTKSENTAAEEVKEMTKSVDTAAKEMKETSRLAVSAAEKMAETTKSLDSAAAGSSGEEVTIVRPAYLDLQEEPEMVPESAGSTPLPKTVTVGNNDPEPSQEVEGRTGELATPSDDPSASELATKSDDERTDMESPTGLLNTLTLEERRLGKVSPFWVPDQDALNCMNCGLKFTMMKRRHHCRACGRVLCSRCCNLRATLEYLNNEEQRVCSPCFQTLAKVMMYEMQSDSESESSPRRRPNPNNPMEYCSTVPPPLQASSASSQPPPSVLVPVGVLKREGTSRVGKDSTKQVMFSDGIRPGGDLTELDGEADQKNTLRKSGRVAKRVGTPPGGVTPSPVHVYPPVDSTTNSFILHKCLPPVCSFNKGETVYQDSWPHDKLMERLRDTSEPPLSFALNRNLYATLKIVKLDCCMNKACWAITTKGMACVGQDELVILIALNGDDDEVVPRDVFVELHTIYQAAAKGQTLTELGAWSIRGSTFLDSKHNGGFLFIRPTFQCVNRIDVPPAPYLVGVLIHRSELLWARVFPIRLMLRLGAEFRYYPCPLLSVRDREPVYYEIGHTIIQLLADFRNLTYNLPNVRGLRIHMEAKQTSVLIPRNRYDQVVRALNNSNDPVLALAGNFSTDADAHLVCMQSKGDEITYHTQAINIHDKPRKVTGASFVVINAALKTTGLAAKNSIVEDGLMVQVHADTMADLRSRLRNMEDWTVVCGPAEEGVSQEEVVRIVWCDDDLYFNIGVKSPVDNSPLDGVPSIRVHSGSDYMGSSRFLRWTQLFIIKCEDGLTSARIGDGLEVNKLSENIARAVCMALTKYLDLLAASGLTVLAVRATIDQDNVGYEAGSNGERLPPIYMNSLDNELVAVLSKAATVMSDSSAILELVFHVMQQ